MKQIALVAVALTLSLCMFGCANDTATSPYIEKNKEIVEKQKADREAAEKAKETEEPKNSPREEETSKPEAADEQKDESSSAESKQKPASFSPSQFPEAYAVLKDATAGGGPDYDKRNVKAYANAAGEGVFFWFESVLNSKFEQYKTNAWIVVDDAVFCLNADSKKGVVCSWPDDAQFAETWATTNLPDSFRITTDRESEATSAIVGIEATE